jgi:uracil-DNA glycosylase
MKIEFEESWAKKLNIEFQKPYFESLVNFVKTDNKEHNCYPPGKLIFNAFNKCPFDNLKVVIIGQDPYHGAGQANGLSFSVNDGVSIPPSLLNIFKELKEDLDLEIPNSGNLERWASQGVLLLNATLTVRANEPGSHQKKGWEEFTNKVIEVINNDCTSVVFLLWGKYAQNKGKIINTEKHFVLKSKHPSPLSANFGGWFGNKHFSQTNNYLKAKGKTGIDW